MTPPVPSGGVAVGEGGWGSDTGVTGADGAAYSDEKAPLEPDCRELSLDSRRGTIYDEAGSWGRVRVGMTVASPIALTRMGDDVMITEGG